MVTRSRIALALSLFASTFCTQLALAGGEPLAIESKDSSVDTVTTDDAGIGRFDRFPFHVSVSVRGGYDDNVFATREHTQDSLFTNASIGMSYDFGDPQTQLSLATGAGVTYYFDIDDGNNDNDFDFDGQDFRGRDDVNLNAYLALNVTHKATPRLTLGAQVYASYQVEPDFALGLGLNRRASNYFITQDRFSVTYLWTPRFSTATHYTFSALMYDDEDIAFYEDRIENTIGNEFRYLFLPTTTAVAEYRFQVITYDQIARDSTSHFALAGFDHSFNPRFNASFRGGVQFREYDNFFDGHDGSLTEPYFEGALRYAVGKRTSVAWTNRYSIEEPDVPGSRSRTTFRTGLQARHNITSRISAGLGIYYQHDENEGIDTAAIVSPAFSEDALNIALTARYAITRYFAVEAGYNRTDIWSDIFLREYSRNRFFAGANFTF